MPSPYPSLTRFAAVVLVCGILTTSSSAQALLSPTYEAQLESWLGQGDLDFTAVFTKVSGDTKTSTDFHTAADGVGPTFTLMSLLGSSPSGIRGLTSDLPAQVVGGYNPQSWDSAGSYHLTGPLNSNAFIYNLTNSTILYQDGPTWSANQTYNSASYGPVFGAGYDLSAWANLEEGEAKSATYGSVVDGPPITFGAIDGSATADSFGIVRIEVYTFAPAAIPEPSSYALFAGVALGFGGFWLRRRKH